MATIAQTRFETVDAGSYRARVEDVELTEGEFGPQLKFKFRLAEESFEDVVLLAWASAKFSPKSKLFSWVNALVFGGAGIDASYDLDTDTLRGRECMLLVEVQRKETGEYNKVRDVIALRRPGNGRKAAVPAPAAGAGAWPTSRVRVGDDGPGEPPEWVGVDDDLPF